MNFIKIFSLSAILLAVVSLSACDLSTPSMVNTSKIRIKKHVVTETFDMHRFNETLADKLARDFMRNGEGKMTLTVSYSNENDNNWKVAAKAGKIFEKAFQKRGVYNIFVEKVAVNSKAHAGKLIVSYRSLIAKAPEECTSITGMNGADTLEGSDRYELGCSTKTAISKMVADPSDLLGKDSHSKIESRRSGAAVENYKAGVTNTPMEGFQASQIGTN